MQQTVRAVRTAAFLAFASILVCASNSSFATTAYNLGVAGNFSAFVFGNMTVTGSTDADHSVAVQGNFSAGTWTAAQNGATYTTGSTEWALVVGGNANWANGSVIDKTESTYIGGTLTVSGPYNPTLGPVQQGGTSPVNFTSAKTQLSNERTRLQGMANTGSVLYGTAKAGGWSGGVYLMGTNSATEYFTLDSSKFGTSNPFMEVNLSNVSASSTIVINIVGSATEVAMGNLSSMLGFSGHETLLNFGSNVSKLTLGSLNGDISVLAMDADITANNGNINGTVIGKNYTGSTQLNGGKPGTYSSSSAGSSTAGQVPEPSTLLLGMSAVGGLLYKRRKQIR